MTKVAQRLERGKIEICCCKNQKKNQTKKQKPVIKCLHYMWGNSILFEGRL